MLDTVSTISVVICAYTERRWNDLLAAVESVRQQSLPPCEIILVIDHNTALFERAKANILGVIIMENTEPRGLSGARNSGIIASRGELIAFLDDDAIAGFRWLELMDRCCQDPCVLGAGGFVVPLWPGTCPAWFPREFYWVVGCSYQDFQGRVTRIRNAFGGNICIRREVFEAVGGFRASLGRSGTKRLPMGGEETELCIRAGQYWPEKFFLCDPNAISEHHIPLQRVNRRYFCSRCYAEGLSKAAMTLYTGTRDGLAAEQAYTRQLLPRGVIQGVRDGLHGDPAGFARSWMIIIGLIATVAGYLVGIISNAFQPRMEDSAGASSLITLIGRSREREVSL